MKKITITLIFLLISLTACSSNESNDISLRLPIQFAEATQTPFYVSLDQGFYKEEGLNVEVLQGSSELNPAKTVSTGTDEFGVLGGPDTMLVTRSRGQPLVAIAVIHRNSNFPVLVTNKDSGITKAEQLDGKKVGFFYGHISTDVLRNMFRKANASVEEVDIGGYSFAQFISGQLDAVFGWSNFAEFAFEGKGIDIHIISPKEYGIITHGYTIFTTEEMIKEHPDVVEKFLRGVIKGIDYSIEHPDEIIEESLMSRNENLNIAVETERMHLINAVTSHSEEYPIGYMDHEMFKTTYDRLLEEGVIENEFDVNDAFTTEFLDRIHGK